MIPPTSRPAWWQSGTLYQIYPRSFQDSDGDGIGDLNGIVHRLDRLVELGVDIVWLSPVYPSPMADFGYDITDYRAIDARFGTMADFDALLGAVHARGMKLILDFVPNHTSDRHPWFRESRASRDNPRRDWYLWRDPAPDGGPPNNWRSEFAGSAWEWDAATGQYYYHAFLKEQPDLNWRNPEVVEAMLDVLRFWFDRGVDGFRIDVLWHLIKDARFRDDPPNPAWTPAMAEMYRVLRLHSEDQPEVHAVAARMRRLADSYGEQLLVGEIYLPVDRLMDYYGRHAPEMNLPFNFQLIDAPWNAPALMRMIADYEAALPPGGWPNWVLGNHDRPRVAHRLGPAQARVAAMLLLTLRGTPTLYYGDEIGMADVPIAPDRVLDPRELREPGKGLGRDPVRTPMAWDAGPNGGFTTGTPWLPMHADRATRNVASERDDPRSMWNLYRALLALRRQRRALSLGDWMPVATGNAILAYERRWGEERMLVLLNLSDRAQCMALPAWARGLPVLLSTHGDGADPSALRADEAMLLG